MSAAFVWPVCAVATVLWLAHLARRAPTLDEGPAPELPRDMQPVVIRNRFGAPTAYVFGFTRDEVLGDMLQALTLEGQILLSRERAKGRTL